MGWFFENTFKSPIINRQKKLDKQLAKANNGNYVAEVTVNIEYFI